MADLFDDLQMRVLLCKQRALVGRQLIEDARIGLMEFRFENCFHFRSANRIDSSQQFAFFGFVLKTHSQISERTIRTKQFKVRLR